MYNTTLNANYERKHEIISLIEEQLSVCKQQNVSNETIRILKLALVDIKTFYQQSFDEIMGDAWYGSDDEKEN